MTYLDTQDKTENLQKIGSSETGRSRRIVVSFTIKILKKKTASKFIAAILLVTKR